MRSSNSKQSSSLSFASISAALDDLLIEITKHPEQPQRTTTNQPAEVPPLEPVVRPIPCAESAYNKASKAFQACLHQLYLFLESNERHPYYLDLRTSGEIFFRTPTQKTYHDLSTCIKKNMNELKTSCTPSFWKKMWHTWLDILIQLKHALSLNKKTNKPVFFRTEAAQKLHAIHQLNEGFSAILRSTLGKEPGGSE